MTEFSKGAKKLQQLFQGNETERMLSASVVRTILSDMIRLYFENRAALGKGCLVFNPEEPEKSKYITKEQLEQDLSIAQEAMDSEITEMFEKILKVIEKEDNDETAIFSMIDENGMHMHLIDAEEANKRIDEAAKGNSGLIF
jgi:hypothetical protein|tara:strand:+ start:531 stop:956 length:426 start_codon:yes stop_codon:yes gene_type:complete